MIGTSVRLRDGQYADITGRCNVSPFVLQGRTRDGVPHLWKENGRWCADDKKNPLDIIEIITPDGVAVALNELHIT